MTDSQRPNERFNQGVEIVRRMREEIAKGSSFRMAIHNGFARAFSSIFDANITTLLTAVVLACLAVPILMG